MSAGCRCGRGSGSGRPDSPAAIPGSRDGTVRSTAVGSSFEGGRIAVNGATGALCAASGRRRSGRPAPRSRGRTPARCVPRGGEFALRSGNRRHGLHREKTGGPERRGRPCRGRGRWKGSRLLHAAYPRLARRSVRKRAMSNRRVIDQADRRPRGKGTGASCRSGRRHIEVRMPGGARISAATAAATTAAGEAATGWRRPGRRRPWRRRPGGGGRGR